MISTTTWPFPSRTRSSAASVPACRATLRRASAAQSAIRSAAVAGTVFVAEKKDVETRSGDASAATVARRSAMATAPGGSGPGSAGQLCRTSRSREACAASTGEDVTKAPEATMVSVDRIVSVQPAVLLALVRPPGRLDLQVLLQLKLAGDGGVSVPAAPPDQDHQGGRGQGLEDQVQGARGMRHGEHVCGGHHRGHGQTRRGREGQLGDVDRGTGQGQHPGGPCRDQRGRTTR